MSRQVAFFPTNGRCPCILCDHVGGGGAPTWWISQATDMGGGKGEKPMRDGSIYSGQ